MQLMQPQGPGNLRPIDGSRESLARLGLEYLLHPNRTPAEIYNTLTGIIADCSRWSRKLINTTCLPSKPLQQVSHPVWRTVIPRHTGTSRRKY